MKFAADEPKVCGACGSSNATKICGNCKEQPYCSLECQREHWREHKTQCVKSVQRTGRPTSGAVPPARPTAQGPSRKGNQVIAGTPLYGDHFRASSPAALQRANAAGARVGLRNEGNTCYLTCVLQALTYSPLAGYLLEVEVGNAPTKRGFNMMFELARHVRKVWSRNEMLSRCEPIAPLLSCTRHAGRMEDAHECLTYVLAQLLEACGVGYDGPTDAAWERSTLVHDVFECTLGQAVVCGACGFHSKAHSVELALRLNATLGLSPEELAKASAKDESPGLGGLAEKSPWKNKAATRAALRIGAAGGRREDTTPPTDVVELLELFFASETIDGYKCDECDQKSTCEKIAGFYQTPNALALYVDRVPAFGALFGKLNRKVAFDETLDLEPFLAPGAPANADETYRLFGVVCHLDVAGSTFFGHYICHVRDSNGEWWSLDDERVIPSDWDHVKDASPYLLFYARNAPHLSPRLTPPKQEPSAKAKARAAKAGAP
ncbi:ubiquitinyl hydrolase [Aureococcus anophagefferens]|uniref:Ubiquitinyl hydrolase n=1 Tax=Aureococcus anophagefferens TaxID=44056 RepID=A0ABR1GDX1_AURAN